MCLKQRIQFYFGFRLHQKNDSDIFDLINTLEESLIKSQKDYKLNLPKKIKEIEDSISKNDNKPQLKIEIINEKLNKNCNEITYEEFINSRIILSWS